MKIALVCPASLPATQFGGIVFLAVDLAREISELGHDVTIYTTDLDFTNGPNKFNNSLPRIERYEKFKISFDDEEVVTLLNIKLIKLALEKHNIYII